MPTSSLVSLEEFNRLLGVVVGKIRADESWRPDTIVALSTGGFPVATALAKRLGIKGRDVVGLPVEHDGDEFWLSDSLVTLGSCAGRRVLVVDDSSNRGLLTREAVEAVTRRGGEAKSCVLIASAQGKQPDFVGETCEGKPPKFYWEPERS